MNKSSKCKNCQWYGKPYWNIINPCDNCPNEEINTIITVNNNGLAISKDNISTSTEKIVLNNVEIIDTDTFYKAVETFNELEKEIKDKDKEIARLNKIIDELEKGLIYTLEYIIDIDKITIKEYNAIYKKATNIDYDFHISFEENIRRLQELKEEGK